MSGWTWISDIYYVSWREMKRYWGQKPRIIMSIIQPLVWLVLMGNMMSGLTDNPFAARMLGVDNYIVFMTPGIMIMSTLFGGVFGGVSLVWDRRIGYLNKMLSAPIWRGAIPVGKMTATALQSIFQVLIIALMAMGLGVRFASGIWGLLLMLIITTLFCFAMAGVSLSIAVMVKSHESLFAIINFLTMPLMFTSNAIFPVAAMPAWLKAIAIWNPLSYAITPMRTLATEGWIWEKIIPGMVVVFLFTFLMVFISNRQFKRYIA